MSFMKSEKELIEALKEKEIPRHVAIIMDGNGRWAISRGLERLVGHRAGVKRVKEVVQTVKEIGIQYLTVYAFSTENWKRPEKEVSGLMLLLVEFLNEEIDYLNAEGVRINTLGHTEALPDYAQEAIEKGKETTKENNQLVLNVALNYGARQEIVDACCQLISKVQSGQLQPDEITEDVFSSALYTQNMPDPDLLIRTSGELRLSNFLLWQVAYSEIYIVDKLWPDFTSQDLILAVSAYQKRDRRYGKIKEEKA